VNISHEIKVKKRILYLDLFKTMLVYGMVLAHVIQLIGNKITPMLAANGISFIVNLTTFSGFMMAFGIGVGSSVPRGNRGVAEQLRPAVMMLASVYTSSLAFVVLVAVKPLTAPLLADLFSMRVLFGYSEFLASFLVLYFLVAVARPLLVTTAMTWWLLVPAIGSCLATTLVTTSVNFPLSATILANTNYASFPLLPYLPWFLIGISIGANGGKMKTWYMLLALIAAACFVCASCITGRSPDRFPPSVLWVVGSAPFLVGYLALSQRISEWATLPPTLLLPGRHALMFLVLSNITIFTTRNHLGEPIGQLWIAVLVALAITLAISFCAFAYEEMHQGATKRPSSIPAGARTVSLSLRCSLWIETRRGLTAKA
jgi:hypothetical protein